MKKPYKPDQLKTGSVPKCKEMNKKLRRGLILTASIILILIGWSFPLLMIIHILPKDLLLMFVGVILIGIGSVTILFLSTDKI